MSVKVLEYNQVGMNICVDVESPSGSQDQETLMYPLVFSKEVYH